MSTSYDQQDNFRNIGKLGNYIVVAFSIFFVLFYLLTTLFYPVGVQYHRGLFVFITFILIFMLFPNKRSNIFWGTNKRMGILDVLGILLTIGTIGYWIIEYNAFSLRIGLYDTTDYYVSIAGIILSLEVSRRVLGNTITIISLVFLAYVYYGYGFLIPDPIEHAGFQGDQMAIDIFMSTNGIFGIMANVLATYVILFVFFGAFLQVSGAGKFFIDLPMALVGKSVGGPAKISVIASAIFGSISGSAIANTVSTGSFTIPLMKKAGFKPHEAGGIEPAASIGGMFLPPIMGAGGFIMAEILNVPYAYIMSVSILPALTYFFAIFCMIHFYAKKNNISGVEKENYLSAKKVFREGWYYIAPLVIIVVFMFIGYSPSFAASLATVSCVVISWFKKETRMGIKKIVEAMVLGTKQSLIIVATVGVIGIIIGSIELTGVGLKLSDIIISIGSNIENFELRKFIIVLLVGLASLILGMGVPVVASYLILVVLVAPALADMGIALIATHMIVYWLSQDSNVTPPVCVAAYAGAAIAKSDPWKTGWTALKYAKMLYVMPLLFLYVPGVLLDGDTQTIIFTWVAVISGTFCFAGLMQGYFFGKTNLVTWLLLIPTTVLLYIPNVYYFSLGLICAVSLYLMQTKFYYRKTA